MRLGELIEQLSKIDSKKPVKFGFGKPNSFRGSYDELAFEPVRDTTVGDMLTHAKSALGKTFQGYKGGDYVMEEWTECWVAEWGDSCEAEALNVSLLAWMLGEETTPKLWAELE